MTQRPLASEKRPASRYRLNSARRNFDKNLESALLLFQVAERFSSNRAIQDDGEPAIRPGQARRIAGLAFLVMVKAWEELVETCLLRYIAGAIAPSGDAPKRTSTEAYTLKSAFKYASENGLGRGPDHLSVNDWSKVCACAQKILDSGKPFSLVSDRQKTLLKHAIKIRNRIAHESGKTRRNFIKIAKAHLALNAEEPLKRGYTVGDLLLTEGTRCFGNGAKKRTYFFHYHQLFLSMADVICPKQTVGR
jgi:hypothetical protein